MKILLVHNNRRIRWADTLRAEEFKKRWKDDEVDILSAEELTDGDKYDVIHFLFSGGITKYRNFILKYKDKVFTSLASQRTLDCMFDKEKHLKEIYQNTRGCVAQNKTLLNKLKKWTDKVVYIPNGVDTELFNRKFVAGCVGAKDSAEHKGFNLAQQACDELGIELKRCKEWDYTHEKMPEFYKQIDCLLIPSLSEGCNNPTLEALAMNVPVISTLTGIAVDLEGVILVERNVESIKQALRRLSGRVQILEDYTWDKIADKYYEVYKSIRHY